MPMTPGRKLTADEAKAAAAAMHEAYIDSLVPGLRGLSEETLADYRKVFAMGGAAADFEEAVRRSKT